MLPSPLDGLTSRLSRQATAGMISVNVNGVQLHATFSTQARCDASMHGYVQKHLRQLAGAIT
jgi:hypothetical protein